MKRLILSFIMASALSAVAMASGSSVRGGGDPCEERIQNVRNDLRDWIKNKGAMSLNLPRGLTVDDYNAGMLAKINDASIRCVANGDAGYPVEVEGIPKVCRFDSDRNVSQITCDFKKMMSLSESDQYVLIHHEYAGLAGIENPIGSDSNYELSSQMLRFLEDRVTKHLVVRPRGTCTLSTVHGDPKPIAVLHDAEGDVMMKVDPFRSGAGRGLASYILTAINDNRMPCTMPPKNCYFWDQSSDRYFVMDGIEIEYFNMLAKPADVNLIRSEKLMKDLRAYGICR